MKNNLSAPLHFLSNLIRKVEKKYEMIPRVMGLNVALSESILQDSNSKGIFFYCIEKLDKRFLIMI